MNDWPVYQPGIAMSRLPVSCCFDPQDYASGQCDSNRAFKTSCISELDKVIKYIIGFLSGILLIAALTQLVAACFACSVAKASD